MERGERSRARQNPLGLSTPAVQREKRFESNCLPGDPSPRSKKIRCGYDTQESWKGLGGISSMT